MSLGQWLESIKWPKDSVQDKGQQCRRESLKESEPEAELQPDKTYLVSRARLFLPAAPRLPELSPLSPQRIRSHGQLLGVGTETSSRWPLHQGPQPGRGRAGGHPGLWPQRPHQLSLGNWATLHQLTDFLSDQDPACTPQWGPSVPSPIYK